MLVLGFPGGTRGPGKRLEVPGGPRLAGERPRGVQLAREHKPDLVIVDVQLPDTDGFNVAEQLAGLDLTLDVILTSGLDSSDLGALVIDSSARGFIPKAELSAAAIEALLASTG